MGIVWNYNTCYIIQVLFYLHSKTNNAIVLPYNINYFNMYKFSYSPNFWEIACWVAELNAAFFSCYQSEEKTEKINSRGYSEVLIFSTWNQIESLLSHIQTIRLRITYFLFFIYLRDKKGKLHHVLLNTVKSRTSFTFISKLHNKLFSA